MIWVLVAAGVLCAAWFFIAVCVRLREMREMAREDDDADP